MNTSESFAAATPGRVFNPPNWAPQHLNTGKPVFSIQKDQVRLLLPETMADWRYHLGAGTENVILSVFLRKHIQTGRPALEWSSEGKYGELSRLVVDLVDVHALDEVFEENAFGLTASLWMDSPGGPVLHAGFPAYIMWFDEGLPADTFAEEPASTPLTDRCLAEAAGIGRCSGAPPHASLRQACRIRT